MKQFAEVRINAQRAVLQSIQNENMEIERLLKLSSSEEISQHLGSLVEHSVRLCSLIHNSNVRFSELDKPFKNPEDKNAKQARSSISAEHDHAHRPSHSDVRFRVWKLNRLHKVSSFVHFCFSGVKLSCALTGFGADSQSVPAERRLHHLQDFEEK